MRLVHTKSIDPGTKLAKAVYNEKGKILIQKNIELTRRMLNRLIQYNITYVYIKDAFTDDIEVNPPVSEEVRIEAYQMIKSTFSDFNKESFHSNSFLFDNSSRMNNIVQEILRQIQNQDEVVSILSDVFVNDNYVFNHSLNVTIYSLALGTELGLNRSKLEELGLGAMLHDVGKMFIPQNILQKQSRLTEEEFEIIKGHTESGFEFLRNTPNVPLLAAHCAFQHHERIDGSGYPRGLKDKEIHPHARLLGIADVFDAVTSDRVYRDAMLPHEGLEILYAGAGTLFDKELVEAFRRTIAVYPNGLTVELSDGRTGVVARQNNNLCERPVIRVLEEHGVEIPPYELDLSKQLDVVVSSCRTALGKEKIK
ncbi:HD-GYP domain-containing protein [Sediminibacillus massiliensis]|uniref:HD-GYP domain-containing protein n=1 Tax=Sediminibacillus massiliensis TaxID=1926277 RepID=UPI00098832CD|nr:HD-GYP domain-containing protein [Sediminibacillus massiliensis]